MYNKSDRHVDIENGDLTWRLFDPSNYRFVIEKEDINEIIELLELYNLENNKLT